MKNQAYHIQALLVDKQDDFELKKPVTKDKEQIQEEKVLLCKLYNVDLPKPKTPEPTFIQDEINNMEKYMKFIQAPVKTMPLYLPLYYKVLRSQEEQDKQYWNKIATTFLEKKHNADTMRKGIPINMYIEGPPHEPYFIVLTLQGQIIIGPTKKMVTSYIVGYLALLD